MGIRLFYLSVLILSIAMGAQFYKNRPKTASKPPKRPAASVNLDDLDLQGPGSQTASEAADTAVAPGSDGQGGETATDTTEAAEPPAVQPPATEAGTPEKDPVLLAFANLSRNPFEPSPFAKLIEQAQASAAAEIAANPTRTSKTKPTEVMATPFGGTIETKNALVAIIDKNIYRTGDVYMGKTIRKIEKTHITLDDPEKIYLMPKIGVRINISTDTLSVVDEFMKHKGP